MKGTQKDKSYAKEQLRNSPSCKAMRFNNDEGERVGFKKILFGLLIIKFN